MKRFRNHFIVGLVLTAGLLIVGCDKETNPTAAAPKKPASPKVTFNGPTTNSTNPYATQAQGFSSMFNGFALEFSALADMPGGTLNGNVWTYTYNYGTFSETITIEQLADGSNKWKVVYNGTEPGGAITFNNWTAFEGTSSADGKSGSLKFYSENSTTLEAEISWTTDAQGNESGIIKTYSNGILGQEIDIINNIDNSGSMKSYMKKSASTAMYLNMEIAWIANGTGTYKVYTEAGVVADQGVF
jgi:hypothetical protein